MKKYLIRYKKMLAGIMAVVLLVTGVGIQLSRSVSDADAAFPSSKTGKTAKMSWNTRVTSTYLKYLGTSCIERIILTSGKEDRAAFCLSPGKGLHNGSTYKSSELNAGYAKKYYNGALAYYYMDKHNVGSDKYTYRAVTQMFIWRITKYKNSTSKDFKASQLATSKFKNCVVNTLNTMKNKGVISYANGKNSTDYYNEAKKIIFDNGEDKEYNKDVSFVKWSDGAGQILLTGKYNPVEEVYVNFRIKKNGVDVNGNVIKNANLAGVVYYVYDDRYCTKRTKDKDGNKLSITLNSNGEGVSSYVQLENDEKKDFYIKEHKNASGVKISDVTTHIRTNASDYKEGTKNTVNIPSSSTIDKVWHTKIKINKQGNDGKNIQGAVFSIYEWNGTKYVDTGDTITTNANGQATSKEYYYTKKNVGKFMVKEKSVPKPYVNEGWSQTLKINGTVTVHEYSVYNVVDKEGDVTVHKVDKVTNEPMDGCIFYLYKYENGEWIFYSKLDNKGNGIYTKTGLKSGSYAVSEINTEDGYMYPAFKDTGGTLRTANDFEKFLVGVDAGGQLRPTYHYVFERNNTMLPASITVEKVDKDTKEPLEGFEFGLYEYKPDVENEEDKYELINIGTTDENGKITFSDLNMTKTYKVKELSAIEGYTIDENNEKIVNMIEATKADTEKVQMSDGVNTKGHEKDMQISKYQAVQGAYDENVTLTFENEKIKRPIKIHKISSNRTGKDTYDVKNAEFKVYNVNDLSESDINDYLNFDNSKYEPVDTVVTDENGLAITKDLPFGKYVLVETSVPDGLLKADNVIVEIDPNIGLTEADNASGVTPEVEDKLDNDDAITDDEVINTDDGKYVNVEIVDAEFEARLNIIKKDKETGETVKQAGVQFKVFDIDNNQYVKQTVYEKEMVKKEVDDVDENGNPIKKEVEVEEIKNSYETDIFTTDENGVAKLPNVLSCGHYYIEEYKAPAGFTLSKDKINFTISKDMSYDIDTEYQDPVININFNNGIIKALFTKTDITTGEPVVGAKLSVITIDGKIIDSWTTDGTEHYIERLPVGEYILREELAPIDKGYVKANDIKFVINDVGDNIQKVEMKDDYTKVQISKTDITGTKEIKGAKLKILNSEGEIVRSWITNGQLSLIERLAVGKYTLVEESAPYGYIISKSVDFEVKETGKIQKVTMVDKEAKGVIKLKKIDKESRKPLSDTEFAVYDSNNKKVDTIITDKDGIGTSKKLDLSTVKNNSTTYTVVETKAKSGYKKDNKKYIVNLKYKDDKTPVVMVDIGTITNEKKPTPTVKEIYEHIKTGIKENFIPFIILFVCVGGIILLTVSDKKGKKKNKNNKE